MSVNSVNISGNITRDPEQRQTRGGTATLAFGVAVNDRRKNDATGQWEDYPNFVDVVVFGARAEALGRFLAKGMKVMISGRLRYSTWEGRDGSKRSRLEVVADEVDVAPRASGGQPAQPSPAAYPPPQMPMPTPRTVQAAPTPRPVAQPAPMPDVYDEEIPFSPSPRRTV